MSNSQSRPISTWSSLLSGVLVTAFSTLLLPTQPAVARNAFLTCDYELQQMGIEAQERTVACGAALYPKDISGCVIGIVNDNDIDPSDALFTCRQVRRPLELATCVTEINQIDVDNVWGLSANQVLQTCRRALLPQRFSRCVVGMSVETELPTQELMGSCIEARDRPSGFYPNLPNGLQPLSPTPGAPPPLPLIPDIEPNLDRLGIPQ